MLSEFVNSHRDEIIARCRTRVAERMAPRPTRSELEHGIPLFLGELLHSLEHELGRRPRASTGAVQHGRDLQRGGFTVAQVVHDYGDVCQVITELAIEHGAPISIEELRALNKCLDDAIAEAVTAYERQHELDVVAEGARRSNEHLSAFAHELHNLLASAMLAFDALRAGGVGIRGSTGDVLSRSLVGLRDLASRSLTEVRLTAGFTRFGQMSVARFLEDVEISAVLRARASGLRLTVTEVDPKLTVESDGQILSSIVSSLLQNAFKYTRPHSHVWLHTRAVADHVLFEIEDQCGGIPPETFDQVVARCEHQSDERTGLAICVRGANALGATIHVRNQNHGCVFSVELPRSQA